MEGRGGNAPLVIYPLVLRPQFRRLCEGHGPCLLSALLSQLVLNTLSLNGNPYKLISERKDAGKEDTAKF